MLIIRSTSKSLVQLFEPYFETNHLVYIDPWFYSAKTATELKKED